MSTDFRALCAELLDAIDHFPGWIPPGKRPVIARARAALAEPAPSAKEPTRQQLMLLAAALAQPAPEALPPDYIDPEHSGADRKLLEVFYTACNSEGGTADEIYLRGIRAVLAAHPLQPIPVSERLPGPEDCDAKGRCWWFCPASILPNGMCPYWCLSLADSPRTWWTHWLPAHALPLPTTEPTNG